MAQGEESPDTGCLRVAVVHLNGAGKQGRWEMLRKELRQAQQPRPTPQHQSGYRQDGRSSDHNYSEHNDVFNNRPSTSTQLVDGPASHNPPAPTYQKEDGAAEVLGVVEVDSTIKAMDNNYSNHSIS